MTGLSQLGFAFLLIWAIAFFRLPLFVWTILVALIIGLLQHYHWIHLSVWILWPLFFALVVPLNIPPLRRRLTQKIFAWFKAVLPLMSDTEKEAIEAGNVWWEKDLFQGKAHWKHFLNMPKPMLTEEEQHFVDNQVETLCAMIDDWKVVHEDCDLSEEVWNYLRHEKFLAMIIPKSYGGLAFSPLAHSAIITKIGTRSISAAVTVMVPNSLGPAELIMHYGTNEQKDYYLPRLAEGKEIPCFALTGPEAGSDAGAIPDKGIVSKGFFEGKEVLGIRLTFDKRYITLAPVATVFGLAFKLRDPDHLLSEKAERGVTLALIPTHHPGVEIGQRHFPLNMAFMNGPIRGKEVFIPIDWIIGGIKMVGKGWQMLMECLSAGRGISLPALSTATGMLSTRMTSAYAAIRRQFNTAIGTFEGIEQALARIAGNTYLLEAMRTFTAGALCQGMKPGVATAIAKYHMTEIARKVMNDAMDIHAGKGIMLGPRNYLARVYQSIPISITVEGANILTRCLMIFGQGAIRCHPFIKKEMDAARLYAENELLALKMFDKAIVKHVGYLISNMVRCITFSLSRGYLSYAPFSKETKPYVKKINWLSTGLAIIADIAMLKLGGDLKRRENISARLGDILSQLYLASAVLKSYHDQGCLSQDWPLAEWCLQTCLKNAQDAFFGFFDNFPQRLTGKALKWLIFPLGKAFSLPKDELCHTCAKLMLMPSDTRERLTRLCYVGLTPEDPTGLIELAFNHAKIAEPLMARLSRAVKEKKINKNLSFEDQVQVALTNKILTAEEVSILEEYEAYRKNVIAVDEFTHDYALGKKECNTDQIQFQTG